MIIYGRRKHPVTSQGTKRTELVLEGRMYVRDECARLLQSLVAATPAALLLHCSLCDLVQ